MLSRSFLKKILKIFNLFFLNYFVDNLQVK
nr:MAG TPA: hypothetical protein [Bacteriophage sp.]